MDFSLRGVNLSAVCQSRKMGKLPTVVGDD